jgi:hypothetical protein
MTVAAMAGLKELEHPIRRKRPGIKSAKRSLAPPKEIDKLETRILLEALNHDADGCDISSIADTLYYSTEMVDRKVKMLLSWRYLGRNRMSLACTPEEALRRYNYADIKNVPATLQLTMLETLIQHGPMTTTQISAVAHRPTDNMCSAFRKLERKKIVKIHPLFITEPGKEALARSEFTAEFRRNGESARAMALLRRRPSSYKALANRLNRNNSGFINLLVSDLERAGKVSVVDGLITVSKRS